jgi:phage tail-like protein
MAAKMAAMSCQSCSVHRPSGFGQARRFGAARYCTEGEAMAESTVNPTRFDPYKNFKFRVKWDGDTIAGVSRISALRHTTEVIEHRDGADPSMLRKSPGRTQYQPITIERGVTHDPAFEQWASRVWTQGAGADAEASPMDFRKDIVIEIHNEAGQIVVAYKVLRCWVSEFQALPDLDANDGGMVLQHIKLENEGWEREISQVEPAQTTEPAEPTGTRFGS